jgi:hypothetical protein
MGGLQASKRFLGVDAIRLSGDRRLQVERTKAGVPVCTENLIRVDDVMESPKLAE